MCILYIAAQQHQFIPVVIPIQYFHASVCPCISHTHVIIITHRHFTASFKTAFSSYLQFIHTSSGLGCSLWQLYLSWQGKMSALRLSSHMTHGTYIHLYRTWCMGQTYLCIYYRSDRVCIYIYVCHTHELICPVSPFPTWYIRISPGRALYHTGVRFTRNNPGQLCDLSPPFLV